VAISAISEISEISELRRFPPPEISPRYLRDLLEITGNYWKSLELTGNHWKSLEITGTD